MTDAARIALNIVADEILAAGTVIEINLPSAVDARAAQASVQLLQRARPVAAQVELARDGMVMKVGLPAEAHGAYRLEIRELIDLKGERIVEMSSTNFSVIPVSGKVPDDHRIEHAARLLIGEAAVQRLAPGARAAQGHVDVLKLVHRKSGQALELAFDAEGRKVDLAAQMEALRARRAERLGRLDETLFARMERAADDERLPVLIWPRMELPPAPYEKPSDRKLESAPPEELKLLEKLSAARGELMQALRSARFEVKEGGDPSARGVDPRVLPFVQAQATPAELRMLARLPAVGVIHYDDPVSINDLGQSIAVAHSDLAHNLGFGGAGVRVAVWEDGPSDTTDLSFAARFDSNPPASNHARLTSGVIRNTEAQRPHGHAPDCQLYSANRASVNALTWAVRDQGCTVVSQSFHRSSEPGGSGLQSDDLTKDWLALRWPYPTIVQAAGNFWNGDPDGIQPPESEFVNHKGYNSLAVGNHNDGASGMSGDSVFRNPSSPHGDRELPEISANGTSVSAVGQTMSGTSFAAPAAAGVAALLQDVDGVLCSWPEGCRAILMAAAGRNVRDGNWWQDILNHVDGRDGAGALDARAGVAIAQRRRGRNASASSRGWDVGMLSSADFGADRLATFRYRVSVPTLLFSPRVKVALAWDSAVSTQGEQPLASTLTVDFDLIVRDSHGVQVASAASWDNSYEVAEFAAQRGESYEIVIRRWSGTDSVWYGLAWNVTGVDLRETLPYDVYHGRGQRP